MVRWLGFEPYQITYSSDNFGKLYDLAEKLITLDKAYVCHCGGILAILFPNPLQLLTLEPCR
jgi:glutamyl/glutaminyl-tRNA synthetase